MTVRILDGREDASHGVQRMIRRRIDWTDVVAKPEKSVHGHGGRINHDAVVNGRRLRVTIDANGAVWTVAIAERST